MRKISIEEKILELGIKLPENEEFWRVGDLTALRKNVNGNFYRSNYHRGLLLYSLITAIKPRNVLEFGTGRGYGALSMARAILDSNLDSHIYSIDFRLFDETQAWPVDYGTGPKVDKTSLKQVWTKYFPSELISKITLLNGTSETIIKDWHAKNLPAPDFAFIDGGHDYETVKHDFYGILKIADEKITILFDDYIDKPKFGICKLVDEEIDPIFKTDLITTFSNWHPVHKANKIHSTSNMIIIDSSTAEAPLESLFDKIEIEYFLKAYRRKIRLQRKIRKIKSFIPPILYHPIKTVSGIILRSKIVQSTIKPIWHWFKRK